MKILIIGAGKVGFNLAEKISAENHDVTIIEQSSKRCNIVQESLDVQCIEGSCSSCRDLERAGIRDTDLMIAVTESDELNIVSCLIGKQYEVPITVARVRNPDYVENNSVSDFSFGIDYIINPEQVTAKEIANLMEIPEALDVEYFDDNKVLLLGLKVKEDSVVIGKKLYELSIKQKFLILAIIRNDNMIIPGGNDVIMANDILYILGRSDEMIEIEHYLGQERAVIEKVIILGGGRVGYYLAKCLEQNKNMSVKLIEKSPDKCKELARRLNKTLIINDDGANQAALIKEGIEDTDAFISVTDDDKLNLLVSLLASHLGAQKALTQIRTTDYASLIKSLGMKDIISPRQLTTAAILKYIRKNKIISVSLLNDDKAEFTELIMPNKHKLTNRPLKDIKTPKDAIIGCIIRDEDIIIPQGNDILLPGDKVMVFALSSAIKKVQEFFSER